MPSQPILVHIAPSSQHLSMATPNTYSRQTASPPSMVRSSIHVHISVVVVVVSGSLKSSSVILHLVSASSEVDNKLGHTCEPVSLDATRAHGDVTQVLLPMGVCLTLVTVTVSFVPIRLAAVCASGIRSPHCPVDIVLEYWLLMTRLRTIHHAGWQKIPSFAVLLVRSVKKKNSPDLSGPSLKLQRIIERRV